MQDNSAPATKEDIRLLMEKMGTLYDANERWKEEILDEMDRKILESEERTKRHFDVAVEAIRHDLLGANRDQLSSHEDRIVRLERHAGLRAA